VELIDKPDLLLVDVREPDEYAAGHIPGAFNLPLRDLAKNLDALPDLDAEIVVYCGSGFRSSIAMTSLQILGYSNVRNMAGGFKAWEGEEFAVTTDVVEAVRGAAPAVDADVLAAVDAGLSGIPDGWGAVTAENLNVELIENAPDMLVDVRTPAERASDGYIAGAVSMPLEELMSHVSELPAAKDANIVVYCKGGHRGNMAATILRTLGYTNVRNLSGGFGGWTTAGLPVEKAEAAPAAQADPVVAALEAYNAALPAGYGNVTVTDLSVELIDKPDLLLVDVREPDEYAAGHIPGAFNLPLRDLAKNLDALPDLDAEIVVYCGSGFRSSIAMTSLQILGYSNVRNMAGGFKAWEGEEFAVTTDVVEAVRGAAPAVDADVLAAVDAGLSGIPDGWGAVTAENLNVELIENAPDMLVDVRTPAERASDGYIAGAVSMPLEELMSHVSELPAAKDANIVVYCKGGHRGNMAATILRTLGYTNVRNLAGGIGGWTTAGLPVEKE